MSDERLREIFEFVVKRGFYHVGSEPWLTSDISHEEMRQLVELALAGKGLSASGGMERAS